MSQRSKRTYEGLFPADSDPVVLDAQDQEQPGKLLRRADKLITAIVGRLGFGGTEYEDYRQDVLLSLVAKFRRLKNDPAIDPIAKYDAYIAQSSYNHLKRKGRPVKGTQNSQSLEANKNSYETLADERPSQAEILVMSEVVKHAWRECVALMTREQLAVSYSIETTSSGS